MGCKSLRTVLARLGGDCHVPSEDLGGLFVIINLTFHSVVVAYKCLDLKTFCFIVGTV